MSAPAGVALRRRPTAPARSTNWMDDAACRGDAAGIEFVSDSAAEQEKAQRFCASSGSGCPVRDECLAYALSRRLEGVWGGELLKRPADGASL